MTVSRYTVAADDRIADVSDGWVEFARANGAPELARESVVGESLWRFVSGREVRHLYGLIFTRVREHDTPVVLPFRCDSPARRRHMRMVISPLYGGVLQLDAVLEREEPRSPVRLLEGHAERSERLLALCSWCKRVRSPGGEWLEVEDAAVRLDLLSAERLPQVTHGICPRCDRAMGGDLGLDPSSGVG